MSIGLLPFSLVSERYNTPGPRCEQLPLVMGAV
jgi:hypothetical protein